MMERKVLNCIIASNVLKHYRSQDSCLDELLLNISKNREARNFSKISVSLPVKAIEIEQIYKRRHELIPDRERNSQLHKAIEDLIRYCVLHPDSLIWNVTFNCTKSSYTPFCGQIGNKLETICVIIGGRIPDDVF